MPAAAAPADTDDGTDDDGSGDLAALPLIGSSSLPHASKDVDTDEAWLAEEPRRCPLLL